MIVKAQVRSFILSMQFGSTPLHKAAEEGHNDVVAILLSYNADSTLQDKVYESLMCMHDLWQRWI